MKCFKWNRSGSPEPYSTAQAQSSVLKKSFPVRTLAFPPPPQLTVLLTPASEPPPPLPQAGGVYTSL